LDKLYKLSKLTFFTVEDAANILGIKKESASVFCSRYMKKGLLVKFKNNLYATSQKFESYDKKDILLTANMLQVPSYISLLTALDYYEITTQVQRNFAESISLKRSTEYDTEGILFKYYRIQKKYYFDFQKTNGIFIASKEKSFIDAVYLYSFGKYKLDINSLDLSKLDKTKINNLMRTYPEKTKKIVRKLFKN
jgi:predicted transcriptional regulator of viral defense system